MKKIDVLQIATIVISVIAMIFSLVSLGKTIYNGAYKKGFNACIEENNLYERYEK